MEDTNTNLLTTLNAEQTAEAIKAAGCAVTSIEHDGVVRLHSASHGIGFQVRWGNETAPGQYADLTLCCPPLMAMFAPVTNAASSDAR